MRMIPVTSNGVVSYTVIINVENRDGSLLPGMTCMVDFIVERAENVLVVSNAALRYQPSTLSSEQISEMVFNASLANMNEEQRQSAIEAREASLQAVSQNSQNQNTGITGLMMGGGQRMPGGGRQSSGTQRQPQGRQIVVMRNLWFINGDGKLDVMQVRTGISDGSFTEVYLDDDFDGRQVILREKI
jgi:HlyD family secretion protein